MSQAILHNARLSTAAAVMVAPILHDIPTLTTLVDLNTRRLHRAAQIAIQFAEFHGLTHYKPVAGLYIWLRLSPEGCNSRDEEEDIVRRCGEHGALIGCGADYAEAQPGWFRLTFALPEHVFLEALRRVEDAVGYQRRFQFRDAGSMGMRSVWTAAFSVLWRGLAFRG
jgi:DNA-binding transcriptional MocR family regulator